MGKTNGKSAAPGDVLELVTGGDGPRCRVSIDGQLFEIVSPGNLSLVGMKRARKAAARVAEIMAADDDALTEAMEADFAASSLAVLETIVPAAPRELLAKLPDAERVRLLGFFTATTPATLPRPTSSPKSHLRRGSRGSTAAARASG